MCILVQNIINHLVEKEAINIIFMPDQNAFHKEIDLVQDLVKRMAQNSFQIKAWLIGILSAIIAFEKEGIFATANGADKQLAIWLNLFLLVPVLCFWYLDAFFLSTEKLYRELYKWIIQYRPKTDAYLYDLNTFTRTIAGETQHLLLAKNSIGNVMLSKTLLPFYVIPLLFVIGLLLYNLFAVVPLKT